MTKNVFRQLSCLILAGITIIGCNKQTDQNDSTGNSTHSIRVRTAQVVHDTIPLPLFIPGKLSTATEIKLSFKTGGIIRELDAPESANIRKGRRIAVLDTVELVAWRNKARTAFAKTKRDLERVEKLYNENVTTLEQLQNARSAYSAAQSDLSITSFNLSQAVLTAPTNGKIIKRLAEKSEIIGPGMPVVIFASTDGRWLIKAAIPDRDLSIINIGDRATVTFDALPQKAFDASLTRIAGAAHPVTGTFEIELSLSNHDKRFRPGLIAKVRLYPKRQKKYSFIPASALVGGNGDSGIVYTIVKTDSIVPLTVHIERLFGNSIAVSRGLEGIETIINEGAAYVHYSSSRIIIDHNRE